MRKSSWVVLAVALLLAGTLVVMKSFGESPTGDEAQILALLNDGRSAVMRKNLRAAMACVSRDYSDPAGNNYDKLRAQIIHAFRTVGSLDILLEGISTEVGGKSARADVSVTVLLFSGEGAASEAYRGPVTILFSKERSRRLLVLPAERWKITGISGLPEVMEEY